MTLNHFHTFAILNKEILQTGGFQDKHDAVDKMICICRAEGAIKLEYILSLTVLNRAKFLHSMYDGEISNWWSSEDKDRERDELITEYYNKLYDLYGSYLQIVQPFLSMLEEKYS